MLYFQDLIAKLMHFWSQQGCAIQQGYDLEVGAGTFNPTTFLRALGPEPYKAVYVEPSRRPQDGRYGENPNRVQFYHQLQVILKPCPDNLQELYLKSLELVGLSPLEHDIRFVHDDWENPTIGAWGLGWEIWADGMEVSQFTYFQAVGGVPLSPISGEITYGLERLAMFIQNKRSIFEVEWNEHLTWGDIFHRGEVEWSQHNFQAADTSLWLRHFNDFEAEAKRLVEQKLTLPAYDFVMKASHAFNILDSRGTLSVSERANYIARVRTLAKMVAQSYLALRTSLNHPLLKEEAVLSAPAASLPHPPAAADFNPKERGDFLLEIGSEELPATFVPIGCRNLERAIKALLEEHKLDYQELNVFGTPRRLALLVRGLSLGTVPESTQRKGPALSAAFDGTGKLTRAGEGFFRAIQLPPLPLSEIRASSSPNLFIEEQKGVEYLFAHLKSSGLSTKALLMGELASLILHLDFPKKMHWNAEGVEYARPIRWLVALFGEEVLPFQLGSLTAGRVTFGHRFLSPQPFALSSPKNYLEELRQHSVLADTEERRAKILSGIARIENELQGRVLAQEKVMPQVLYLTEWPELCRGYFNPDYLKVPKEVLISEMVEHQKYFPVEREGALLPEFIITCNIPPSETIRKGNEYAVTPRLADGMFLYAQDLKETLESFNQQLHNVTFQKDLGTLFAKVQRLQANIAILHSYLPLADLSLCQRAALLSKADLTTELVKEFPELQGIAGRIYATHHQEPSAVALALDEQWMPRGEQGALPQSAVGTLLSLADKLDNFLSYFTLGLEPTSSSDPFALRRQALGIAKILIQGKHFLPLREVLKRSFGQFLENRELSPSFISVALAREEEILQRIQYYILGRLRTIFLELGFEKDEIEAILSPASQKRELDIYDLYCQLASLKEFRAEEAHFAAVDEMFTRCKKILHFQNPQLQPLYSASSIERYPAVDPHLLSDPHEKALHASFIHVKQQIEHYLSNRSTRNYVSAFHLLSTLRPRVTAFFDNLKVIDPDEKIKNNRLALLQEVWDLCEELADLSKLQIHKTLKT